MPFNAILEFREREWVFKNPLICDIFNANDVLFSTASIVHLCDISVDRYLAIIKPLHYERLMTHHVASMMLVLTWVVSFLISQIPIHTQIYTTPEWLVARELRPELCEFTVNRVYAVISSTVSFWAPSVIMVTVYVVIFRAAKHQEDEMLKVQRFRLQQQCVSQNPQRNGSSRCATPLLTHRIHPQQQQQVAAATATATVTAATPPLKTCPATSPLTQCTPTPSGEILERPESPTTPGQPALASHVYNLARNSIACLEIANSTGNSNHKSRSGSGNTMTSGASGQSGVSAGSVANLCNRFTRQARNSGGCPPNGSDGGAKSGFFSRSNSRSAVDYGGGDNTLKIKREHKAAKTLGIIMAAFLGACRCHVHTTILSKGLE